jgi:hypothetical protein
MNYYSSKGGNMKFFRIAMVLAIALCLAGSVYAETQSVKVSGDLTVRGIWRGDYDYRSATPASDPARTGMTRDTGGMNGVASPGAGGGTIAGGYYGASQSWWMSQAEVQVDAELTDNVSTVIRILNQRDWNVQNKNIVAGQDLRPNGLGGYVPQTDEFEVQLDLAYVTLKNFVYCPLTVTIGRQDLWFGKGFIIGSNQINNNWIDLQGANNNILHAPEYTSMNAFDSIKAVLDYDPWTITGVWANIWNNTVGEADGIDLWGINVGYKFDCYKAEAEAYWFYKRDNSIEQWRTNMWGNSNVHTFGIRGSMDPIECVTLSGEVAVQAGAYTANTLQLATRERAAWALDVAAEYRGLMDCWAWKPKAGIEYILYSGNKDDENLANNNTNAYTGWDRMFRGKYDSAIREWVGTYYASYDYGPRSNSLPSCADASFTNQSQLIFSGSLQPMDCLTLKGNWNLFWTVEDYVTWPNVPAQQAGSFSQGQKRGGLIGNELDVQAIWDYTEDVSFGLLMGWFMPNGDVYYAGNNDTASDIVGTVKVSF